MPGFKLGGVTPDNVKMGSDQVDKIYMGAVMVWEAPVSSTDNTFNTRTTSAQTGNFQSVENMSDHDWSTTYNMDGLQCIYNFGVAMFFDSSSDATNFMSDVSADGISMRVDQNIDHGGPGPLRSCLKADLTQTGNSIRSIWACGNL